MAIILCNVTLSCDVTTHYDVFNARAAYSSYGSQCLFNALKRRDNADDSASVAVLSVPRIFALWPALKLQKMYVMMWRHHLCSRAIINKQRSNNRLLTYIISRQQYDNNNAARLFVPWRNRPSPTYDCRLTAGDNKQMQPTGCQQRGERNASKLPICDIAPM